MKDLLSDINEQRERQKGCESNISAFTKTNNDDELDDFVTSIIHDGVDDTMREEYEREEYPEQLQIYETSKETERQAPITRAEHRRQAEQHRPTKRKRTLTTREKRKEQINNDFAAAFDSVPIAEQERPRTNLRYPCCLGTECINTHIQGTMKCHGD